MAKALGLLLALSISAPAWASAPLCAVVLKHPVQLGCGEHCGVRRETELGYYSAEPHYTYAKILSADPNQIVRLYQDSTHADEESPAFLVVLDPITKNSHEIELPASFGGKTILLNGMNSEHFFAAVSGQQGSTDYQLQIFNKSSEKVTKISLAGYTNGPVDFTWKNPAHPESFFYFNALSGKLESFQATAGQTISNLGTSESMKGYLQIDLVNPDATIFVSTAELHYQKTYSQYHIPGMTSSTMVAAFNGKASRYVLMDPSTYVLKVMDLNHPDQEIASIQGSRSITKIELTDDGGKIMVNYLDPKPTLMNAIFANRSDSYVKIVDLSGEQKGQVTFSREFPDQKYFAALSGDQGALLLISKDPNSTNQIFEAYDLKTGETTIMKDQDIQNSGVIGKSSVANFNLTGIHVLPGSRSLYFNQSKVILNFQDKTASLITASSTNLNYDPGSSTLVKEYQIGNDYKVVQTIHIGVTKPKEKSTIPGKVANSSIVEVMRQSVESGKMDDSAFVQLVRPFFESGAYKNEPKLTADVVLWMGAHAPGMVGKYLAYYKDIPDVIIKLESSTVEDSQKKRINKDSQAFIKNVLTSDFPFTIAILPVLKTYFQDPPDKDQAREELVHIAEAHLQKHSGVYGSLFSQIDPGVNLNLLVQSFRRTMGLKYRKYTDVMVTTQGKVIAYATDPIEGGSVNEYGLAAKELTNIPVNNPIEQAVSWNFEGRVQNAVVKITPIHLDGSLIPNRADSLNYQELRHNGVLTGVIGISANLGEGFARELGQEYQSYFEERGFEFEILPFQQGGQAFDYLIERIQSGEVGYFLREGHGENRGEYAISVTPNMEIAKGVNNATHEVVYILLPGNRNTSLPVYNPGLTFSVLGHALRTRPNPNAQFFYLESKCNGLTIVGDVTKKIAAHGVIVSGSNQLATTFTDAPESGMRVLLDGLRAERPYAEMSSSTADTPFFFPNTDTYFSALGNFSNFTPTSMYIERHLDVPTENTP